MISMSKSASNVSSVQLSTIEEELREEQPQQCASVEESVREDVEEEKTNEPVPVPEVQGMAAVVVAPSPSLKLSMSAEQKLKLSMSEHKLSMSGEQVLVTEASTSVDESVELTVDQLFQEVGVQSDVTEKKSSDPLDDIKEPAKVFVDIVRKESSMSIEKQPTMEEQQPTQQPVQQPADVPVAGKQVTRMSSWLVSKFSSKFNCGIPDPQTCCAPPDVGAFDGLGTSFDFNKQPTAEQPPAEQTIAELQPTAEPSITKSLSQEPTQQTSSMAPEKVEPKKEPEQVVLSKAVSEESIEQVLTKEKTSKRWKGKLQKKKNLLKKLAKKIY